MISIIRLTVARSHATSFDFRGVRTKLWATHPAVERHGSPLYTPRRKARCSSSSIGDLAAVISFRHISSALQQCRCLLMHPERSLGRTILTSSDPVSAVRRKPCGDAADAAENEAIRTRQHRFRGPTASTDRHHPALSRCCAWKAGGQRLKAHMQTCVGEVERTCYRDRQPVALHPI